MTETIVCRLEVYRGGRKTCEFATILGQNRVQAIIYQPDGTIRAVETGTIDELEAAIRADTEQPPLRKRQSRE